MQDGAEPADGRAINTGAVIDHHAGHELPITLTHHARFGFVDRKTFVQRDVADARQHVADFLRRLAAGGEAQIVGIACVRPAELAGDAVQA